MTLHVTTYLAASVAITRAQALGLISTAQARALRVFLAEVM